MRKYNCNKCGKALVAFCRHEPMYWNVWCPSCRILHDILDNRTRGNFESAIVHPTNVPGMLRNVPGLAAYVANQAKTLKS